MSPSRSLGTVVRAMILAGLLAGGVLGIFHTILTAPVVDQAIAFEVTASGLDSQPMPLAPRQQQKISLALGALLYGLFVGVMFGSFYYLSQDALPAGRVFARAALLALMAYWVVGLFPFLKYPDNPPGVGHSLTIEFRQALHGGFVLLSLAGGLVTANAARYVEHRRLVALGYAVFALAAYLLMPANPDPIDIPMSIVSTYRALSLAGLTIFWTVLGLSFDHPSHGFQPRAA
jgi:hypothetical protein